MMYNVIFPRILTNVQHLLFFLGGGATLLDFNQSEADRGGRFLNNAYLRLLRHEQISLFTPALNARWIQNRVKTQNQRLERKRQPCHWHIGSAFIFCPGNCPFKSEPTPTSTDACGEVTSCTAQPPRCVAPEVDLGECTLHLPP